MTKCKICSGGSFGNLDTHHGDYKICQRCGAIHDINGDVVYDGRYYGNKDNFIKNMRSV